MADEEKAAKAAKEKKGGGFKIIFLMTLIGCLVPFGVPTLLICLGFLPTLVALFTDTDPRRSGVACIAYMNLAGVFPYLVELWQKGQNMEVAVAIIRNPMSWAVMLGAAGIGQLILYLVPPIVASVVSINQENRLKTLHEGLKELEKVWGPDVGTMAPLDIVRHNKGV